MSRITKRVVDAARPRDKEYVIWDSEISGFGLRVRPATPKHPHGRKVYIFKYRVGGGRRGTQRKPTIGTHGPLTAAQARDIAKDWAVVVRKGGDPGGEIKRRRETNTVAELWDRYLAEHATPNKRPRSVEEDSRNARLHILPALGRKKVADLTFGDVDRLHKSMRDRPTGANRVLALLSHMLRMAEKWDIRPQHSNPCREVEKFDETHRQRFLDESELARLATAMNDPEELPAAVAAIRLLLFTGCRRTEILALRWDQVDFEQRCLRLPTSKTGAKVVYLNAPALEVLSNVKRVRDNPYVIVGQRAKQHLADIAGPWRRIRARAGLSDLRLHDLRHSFASAGAAAGLSLQMIGKMLGHAQTATTARYAHLADDPVRQAVEQVGAAVAASMEGDSAEVVELPRKRNPT